MLIEIQSSLASQEPEKLAWAERTPIIELAKTRENFSEIYAVLYNGKLHDLNWMPKGNGVLTWVEKDSEIGRQVYNRSLNFLFIAAVHRHFPQAQVHIEHAISNGVFCMLHQDGQGLQLSESQIAQIEQSMKDIVKEKQLFERDVVATQDAVHYFEQQGHRFKAKLLANRSSKTSSIYHLDGVADYFYGIMLPDTSYLSEFSIRKYDKGIWLSPSGDFKESRKLFELFQQFEAWGRLIGVSHIAQLNDRIIEGKTDEIVLMSETMIEKQLSELAGNIVVHHPKVRTILISGPSSAGKTTFSRRLAIHLKIHGKEPMTISMDDFFKDRDETPKLPDGSYDFESPNALDLELFNKTILALLNHEKVRMPRFNFKSGMKEWDEKEVQIKPHQILIIEGIHGLNPIVSANIPQDVKFKIYINALTHLNLDEHNRIPTSDYRLIRRLARDYQFRGRSATQTIQFWKSVRDGEDQYIYPYQEEADAIFNSSMVYELAVLKKLVTPLLNEITLEQPEYNEANRIKKLLEYFADADTSAIPRSSILAEFIGTSVFDVG